MLPLSPADDPADDAGKEDVMPVNAQSVAQLAGLLADRTRMTLLLALLDGRAWTMGELARHAGVGASTASEALSRLVAADLLVEERQGRHRYLRLADPQVAYLHAHYAGAGCYAARIERA